MRIRPVVIGDARVLFDWRNDPLTRAMSRTTDPVEWDRHVAWLTRRLEAPEPHLYIAEVDGRPVGTIRIDGEEVSYTVTPSERGKGYAVEMLRWARERFGMLTAGIKPENEASIRAAEKAGHNVRLLRD
ncbi:GNAT family N-acetyltransferase [Microvirga sp. M2]|uniref:GNAT family N-acetyltransferase n=1 Tax=Microvirga sp. M2 TaxID=3073270 RepID=UPI0039C1A9D9